jgi:capsular exopolysaccharide synthesis family protein
MNIPHQVRKPEGVSAEYRQDEEDAQPRIAVREIIELHEILQILSRQKKVIIAATLLVMILAYVVVTSLTPRYTASGFVEINARHERVADFDAVLTGLSADEETIQTEIAIIQSRKIARRVVERLDLSLDPEFNSSLRPFGLLQSWRISLAEWISGYDEASSPKSQGHAGPESEDGAGFFDEITHGLAGYLAPPSVAGGAGDEFAKSENDKIIDAFLKHLSVERQRRSRIVKISFESKSPKIAAAAANSTADFYIVAQLEAKFEATKRATTWLNERVLQLREELTLKEKAIEQYRATSGLLEGGTSATLASEQISELNAQHVLEVARLAEARARLRQANKLLESPGSIETSIEVLESPLILELRAQEALVEREIAELAEEYGDRHPTLISKRAESQDLQTKIRVEIDRVIQGLRNEVAIASARASSLAASLDQYKQNMAQLNQSEVGLRALELDASASRTLLETLLQRTKQTTSQETFQQADANIISYAVVPRKPSYPRKSLILALTLVLAVALGVVLAFIIERLDAGLRSGEQVSRYLGLKSLGLLPRLSKFSSGGRAPYDYILDNPDSAYGEAIRSLYTNVLLTDMARRPKVIMVTSSLPNEGKTTVALSLARMMAMYNHSVLVVDCDLKNPGVHQKLGIEQGPGLTEFLSAGVPVVDMIQVDEASGVHVVRAGTAVRNSPDQLDSDAMQKLLRQLGRQYDLVLLDSAPLLAASDSLFLARLADKTIFLVQWAKTRRAAAKHGLDQILAAEAEVAGVLLTMVDVKSHATYSYGDSGVYQGKFRKYYTG